MLQLANHTGLTPLHEAAGSGHTDAAQVLLSVGASNDVLDQVMAQQICI